MNKLKLQIFGGESEIKEFIGGKDRLEIDFGERVNGYLLFGHIYLRVESDRAIIGISSLPDGDYQPQLVLEDRTVKLPPMSLSLGILSPTKCDSDYIRALSLRQRRLEESLKTVYARLDQAEKKIFGESIF